MSDQDLYIEGIKQVSEEQAKAIYDSEIWKNWNAEEKAKFQLFQKRLCMPFGEFHSALEKVLDRLIWTHEFAFTLGGIYQEYFGLKEKPTMEEIINLIPEDKKAYFY